MTRVCVADCRIFPGFTRDSLHRCTLCSHSRCNHCRPLQTVAIRCIVANFACNGCNDATNTIALFGEITEPIFRMPEYLEIRGGPLLGTLATLSQNALFFGLGSGQLKGEQLQYA